MILSLKSMWKLRGVNPKLVNVVKRAIQLSDVDFFVIEGVRSFARQQIMVKTGASKTFNSKHLTGDAVDLGALDENVSTWEPKFYYPIAKAMQKAAAELGVDVVWGGCWKSLAGINLEEEVKAYVSRMKQAKKKPLVDMVHFELKG